MSINIGSAECVVVTGKPDAVNEKPRYRVVMAYSDTSRLEETYGAQSPEERERFIRSLIENTSFKLNLKHN